MKISRIRIKNFRNLKDIDINLDQHAVILGENGSGKSNLIFALRILLDPYLPDPRRHLLAEDFWEGISKPYAGDEIVIEAEFEDFQDNDALKACFADAIIDLSLTHPVAKIGYIFRMKRSLSGEKVEGLKKNYEYIFYQKDNSENLLGNLFREKIQFFVLKALRDAEKDLRNKEDSPLSPFLDRLYENIPSKTLDELTKAVDTSSSKISDIDEIKELSGQLFKRLKSMVGTNYPINPNFGVASTDPRRVLNSLKLYLNESKTYSVDKSSLGYSNLIYLMLHILNMEEKERDENFAAGILGIEEPEAHLHPQLQRLIFKDIFTRKNPTIITTHSPNIASVAPIKSIVLLKNKGNFCEANSLFKIGLTKEEIADIERYIDVTRGEIYFSKGIIFVEGIAEVFILKKIAKLSGFGLDENGISICSVNGTHFNTYLKLVEKNGLNIPYVLLTDGDVNSTETGYDRANMLCENITSKRIFSTFERSRCLEYYDLFKNQNIYVGDVTLEIDLIKSQKIAVLQTIKQLNPNATDSTIAQLNEMFTRILSQDDLDSILKKIKIIGKGRFAQRLANNLVLGSFPRYIVESLEKIVSLTKNAN